MSWGIAKATQHVFALLVRNFGSSATPRAPKYSIDSDQTLQVDHSLYLMHIILYVLPIPAHVIFQMFNVSQHVISCPLTVICNLGISGARSSKNFTYYTPGIRNILGVYNFCLFSYNVCVCVNFFFLSRISQEVLNLGF